MVAPHAGPSAGTPTAGTEPSSGRRARILSLSLLGVLGLALMARFLNGDLAEWGGDNVSFLLLARALAGGYGYVDLHLADVPPHTHYPPLFPLLLAPLVAAGASLLVIKAWVALLSLAGIGAVYLLLERSYGALVALLVSAATLVSSVFLDAGFSVMSDGPYLLLACTGLLLGARLLAAREASGWTCLGVGLVLGAAVLTRLVGMALLPALGAAALLAPSETRLPRRLLRAVVAGGVACLLIAAWFLRGLMGFGLAGAPPPPPEAVAPAEESGEEQPSEEQLAADEALEEEAPEEVELDTGPAQPAVAPIAYIEELTRNEDAGGVAGVNPASASLLDRPTLNVKDLWLRLRWLPAPELVRAQGRWAVRTFRFVVLGGTILLTSLAVLGFLRRLLLRRQMLDFYFAVYMAGILVWVGGGPRLMLPVLPFLVAYVADGVHVLGRAVLLVLRRPASPPSLRRVRLAELGFLVLALAFSAGLTFGSPRMRERIEGRYNDWWHDYLALIEVLGERARPGDQVLAMPPQVPYYRIGMHSARMRARERTPQEVVEQVLARPITYVLTTPFQEYRYGPTLVRAIQRNPDRFELIAEHGKARLYRVRRDR